MARMTREALVAEVSAQREALMQACWAHRLWYTRELKTTDGRPLEVIEPGWLNRGAGPDFTEARLLIGNSEFWGDVEVHLSEREWWEHGHHQDAGYGRVVLHVVLRRSGRPAVSPVGGAVIPVFEAAAYLSSKVLETMHEPEELLRRYERLPGRCGIRAAQLGEGALNTVIANAAEVRARDKAERLAPMFGEGADEEQVLFRLLFRYLGYRPYGGFFEELARRYPLAELVPLFDRSTDAARVEVLARWFGAGGLLEATNPPEPETGLEVEYAELRDRWVTLGHGRLADGLPRKGSRPWNAPERRLVGMFHHLQATVSDGWLKSWLAFLKVLDGLRDHPDFRREAIAQLERMFATPPDEPWRNRVSFAVPPLARSARLIGQERVVMLMVNAVLPFFLAQARRQGDRELEKVLYRLYLVLPPEGANHRTRFMELRLGALAPAKPSLRSHQGLLQIHQDFCASFHHGCDNCGFPDLIGSGGGG